MSESQMSESQEPSVARQRQLVGELLARYAWAADHLVGRGEEGLETARRALQEIFTRDAHIEVVGQISVEGPGSWLEIIARSTEGLEATQHLLGLPVVDIDDGRATISCPLQATQIGAGTITRILGTYRATAVRDDSSAWRLARLSLEVLAIGPPPQEELTR